MFDTMYEYGESEVMEGEAYSGLTHLNHGDLGGFTSSAPSLPQKTQALFTTA